MTSGSHSHYRHLFQFWSQLPLVMSRQKSKTKIKSTAAVRSRAAAVLFIPPRFFIEKIFE
jgi:hypothetical protein